MYDRRNKLTEQIENDVREYLGAQVYKTVIPRNIRLSEAPGFGKPIFLYDKDSEGARKYKELTKEFILNNATHFYKTSYDNQSESQATVIQEGENNG